MTQAGTPSTLQTMHLRGFRPDPLKVDAVLAVLLAVVGEVEIWIGSGVVTHHHRVAIGSSMLAMAATVGLRRRYPAASGLVAASLANFVALAWAPPSSASYGV